ncbi:hypothetical protein [Pantoea stewartii]|uniref:hypothetical protein n=1 Tax=Pantoea stewartii TaxID=66269 RepID=UPI001561E083|nr:hypothetical protein [Pantoea stewartii]NRH22582.1 hypothetical protein [Pantoea stewartii]
MPLELHGGKTISPCPLYYLRKRSDPLYVRLNWHWPALTRFWMIIPTSLCIRVGVTAKLHLWPGAFHGFNNSDTAAVSLQV